MTVSLAQTDQDILDCWPVIVQLRPHLKQSEFISTIRKQFAEGYQLALVRRGDKVAAIAGFRFLHNLIWGRFLYVDDLVTDEHARSQGLGAELMNWLADHARQQGCHRLDLDSGVQRFDAHRFYFREGMHISWYHFTKDLRQAASP
jgi:GNAT superfamily N-acetyltransferase